jgi:prevent-host-death family protein
MAIIAVKDIKSFWDTESEVPMKTMAAGEAKNNFGVLMDTAQREAVAISKKGRTAAILLPVQDYEEYQELKLDRLRREIKIGIDEAERGEVSDGEAFFDELEKERMIDGTVQADGNRKKGLARNKRVHEGNMG